jgi:hypothetical protein
MIRFSFSFDEIPQELITESTAFYRLDGLLRLDAGMEAIFEEEGMPLVELAVWLFHWMKSNKTTRSFLPDGYDEDYGPMLQIAPTDVNQYCLSYNYGENTSTLTAALDEWEAAFKQFLDDLRQAVKDKYNLQLDAVLHRFSAIS